MHHLISNVDERPLNSTRVSGTMLYKHLPYPLLPSAITTPKLAIFSHPASKIPHRGITRSDLTPGFLCNETRLLHEQRMRGPTA